MENVALIEWLNTFSFGESISLENGIIFEKLIALLEGSSLVKENWSTYAWDLPFYKKRLANVYFKFGCGSSLENTLKLIEEYQVCLS
jgi:hypothetical protein